MRCASKAKGKMSEVSRTRSRLRPSIPTSTSAPIAGIQAWRPTICRPAAAGSKCRHNISAQKRGEQIAPERDGAGIIPRRDAHKERPENRNENQSRDQVSHA